MSCRIIPFTSRSVIARVEFAKELGNIRKALDVKVGATVAFRSQPR